MSHIKLIRFLDFELCLESLQLSRNGTVLNLEPQVFDLIKFFAENAGGLVSREEILEGVWGGRIVSDAAISTRINAVRTILGDDGKSQRVLKTIPRRGFRFLPEPSFYPPFSNSSPLATTKNMETADKPTVAVMPFECLNEGQMSQSLAQGLRIDIQNALIRISGLGVIAIGSSSAAAKLAPQDAAAALNAQYMLNGQVRRSGDTVRFSAQLIETRNHSVVWSDQLDRKVEDTFLFLDDITREILTAMSVQLVAGEAARIWHKVLPDLKSLEVFYRGIDNFFKMTKASLGVARHDFENVTRHHPDLSLGATWISLAHWFDLQRGWSSSPEKSHALARKWAEKAAAFEDSDGQAFTVLSHLYLLDRKFDAALQAGASAVQNRPSCANANGFYANVLHFCGEQDAALEHIKSAIRYSPFHPPFFSLVLAAVMRAQGNLSGAVRPAREALNKNDEDLEAMVLLCAIDMEQGETKAAISRGVRIAKISADFSVNGYLQRQPYRGKAIPEKLSQLLGDAKLPE